MRPRFPFGNNNNNNSNKSTPDVMVNDPTEWLIHSGFAEFLLLHTLPIKYMIMFGYTYLCGMLFSFCVLLLLCENDASPRVLTRLPSFFSHTYNTKGCKLFTNTFTTSQPTTSMIYQYVSMILQCTGGGIIVPLLINGIPVPIGQDSYIIIISISFLLHYYFPMLRDVTIQSSILYGTMIVMYEMMRAYVVVKFITLAATTIAPSEFTIPMFGPIICGTIAGCGAAFVPFNKGLDAIKYAIIPPVISAGIGSIFYHVIVHGTSLLQPRASAKGHVLLAIFFIAYHISITDFHHHAPPTSSVDGKKKQ